MSERFLILNVRATLNARREARCFDMLWRSQTGLTPDVAQAMRYDQESAEMHSYDQGGDSQKARHDIAVPEREALKLMVSGRVSVLHLQGLIHRFPAKHTPAQVVVQSGK